MAALSKSGGGALVLEPYERSSFAGPIIVNAGILQAKGDGAFGTSAGGVTINSGGTVKLDSGWTYGDDFTVSGPGSIIPGSGFVREAGALIAESSTNRLTGAVILNGDATLAGNSFLDPSVTPGAGGLAFRIGTLVIAGPTGVTGSGNLTLSGPGDGVIVNGVNTSSGGVIKDGAGRWTVNGASTYSGTTAVSAGILRIANSGALGSTGAGTTVFGGAALELSGGVSVAEPLTLNGIGTSIQSGAINSVNGSNTLTGPVVLGTNTTLRADNGTLALAAGASVTGVDTALVLTGNGTGTIAGSLNLGSVSSTDAITKNGTGIWTLGGNGVFTGGTRVNGGTLAITASGQVLDFGSPLTLGGGNLVVTGGVQAVDNLTLAAGGGTVNGGANGISIGFINRSTGAAVNFAGNIIAAGSINANDILGGFATYGSDWAMVNGASQILPFNSYVPLGTAGISDNAIVTPVGVNVTGSVTANSLKVIGGAGFGLGANTLALTSGGLLFNGSSTTGISGSGLISGELGTNDLVHQYRFGHLGVGSADHRHGRIEQCADQERRRKIGAFRQQPLTRVRFSSTVAFSPSMVLAAQTIQERWGAIPSGR